MNILQVLSQFEVTGAETFAATLADAQIAAGHTVYIISDNFYTSTKATVISHPIGKRDIQQRLSNISFLRKFIREHKIDVVHAHSRAASWVCYFAARGGKVPLVSSIHGRQHLHFSSTLFSIYGEKRVAVCKSIYDHLTHDLKYGLETLALVHNGIDAAKWKYQKHKPPKRKKKIVSFVGRLSGFKGDTLLIIVEQIFPKIFEQYRDVEFHIIGGMNEKSKIIPAMEQVNKRVGVEFIIAKGFSSDVESVYRQSDLIVGSGRVAMEALACGAPVVSIGESNFVGIISEETRNEALVTNFGDLDARRPIDVEKSVEAIMKALQSPETISGEWGRKFIEEHFEISSVASQMYGVYAEAIAIKSGIEEIPVLSYQRIISDEEYEQTVALGIRSIHPFKRFLQKLSGTIFGAPLYPVQEGKERVIAASEFQRQMSFIQKKGFSVINFWNLDDIASCKKIVPSKPIILTFDSYRENAAVASPILQQYGFTGVFFVQTNEKLPDGRPAMELSEAKALSIRGYEIGSASHTRPKMNLLSEEEIQEEIRLSKELLGKATGGRVQTFAYPHGYCNEKIKAVVKEAGYRYAVTIDGGRKILWSDFYKIRRIQIFTGYSMFSYWKKTSGKYYRYKYVY